MWRNLTRTLALAGLAIAIGSTSLGVAEAAPAPQAPAAPAASAAPYVAPMEQDFRWDWSDGSDATSRTFAQSAYGSQASLPHLIVMQYPARPAHKVYLQYFQDGAWHTETTTFTNGAGRATLDLDPYCNDNQWCDGTYSYRLKVAGHVKRFRIHYTSG